MQLEELQQQWQRLDNKLEQTLKMNRELLLLTVKQPVRRRVNRLTIVPSLDMAFGAAILFWTGSFLVKHANAGMLAGFAAVVMLSAILLIATSIHQLILILDLDWGRSVADIQSSLTRLRLAKIRQFKWSILLAPLAGFCGLIMVLQGLLDRQPEPQWILDQLHSGWVISNLLFGVLFIPFGYFLARWLSRRFQGQGWWQRVIDDLSGSSLKKAKQDLDRWSNLDTAS
jgi:hypothetical protein